MGKRRGGAKEHTGSSMPRHYEGEEVLGALLQAGGSAVSVDEVKERLRAAHREGGAPAQVFPGLFPAEPHFPSPDLALRLYANLFGLWDRIAAGVQLEPIAKQGDGEEEEREPAPKPAPIAEGPLTDEFVEAAWRHLADLPQREMERLMHRYENTQPELSEWVRQEAGEPNAALENADTLAFELWAMFELAKPQPKPRVVLMTELEAARKATEMPEPTLERYANEALEEAKLDEEDPLQPADAERVGQIIRAVIRCLAVR